MDQNRINQSGQIFSCHEQIMNILDFVGYMIMVVVTQFC